MAIAAATAAPQNSFFSDPLESVDPEIFGAIRSAIPMAWRGVSFCREEQSESSTTGDCSFSASPCQAAASIERDACAASLTDHARIHSLASVNITSLPMPPHVPRHHIARKRRVSSG